MASTFFGLHIGSVLEGSFQAATNTTANNIANVKTAPDKHEAGGYPAGKGCDKCHSPLRKRRHRC